MPRFFAEKENISGDIILLKGQDVNHIKNVLRMSVGDAVTVSDGEGFDYYCSISGVSGTELSLSVTDKWRSFSELPVKIYLFPFTVISPLFTVISSIIFILSSF